MSNQDWYRKTNWTKRDKEDFFKHLERSRKSGRVQFLKIQANYLYETNRINEISAALELNNLALSENPEKYLSSANIRTKSIMPKQTRQIR